jgi:NAD(P)-dependent dehydrogenase (short-subunit alcohol dehydrogenase family)
MFARAGYALALAGRTVAKLRETASLADRNEALILEADLTDARAARAIVDRAVARFSRLDILVNNAGEAPNLPIEAHTAEILDRIYRINALAPANSIAQAWPVFVRQASGRIINVSTIGTLDPFPGFFGYAAAKAALNTMTMSCATEGKAHGIGAFCIAPGAVETPMLRAFMTEAALPRSRTLDPDVVAQVILDCALGRRDAENGRTIVVKP